MATYEQAIKFYSAQIDEARDKSMAAMEKGCSFQAAIAWQSRRLDGILDAIVFIFGKTDAAVKRDILKEEFKEYL